jgi:hypothetical protein
MTSGPIRIMKAAGCKRPVKFTTIGTINISVASVLATYWTDGKRESSILPDERWFHKSPSQGALFWSDECQEIGRYFDRVGELEKEEWRDLDYAVEPSEEDYSAALAPDVGSSGERMRYLRMRLWWLGNDPIRKNKEKRLSEPHLANLRQFADLLSDDDPNQRLMKAEVLRELSRFDEALHLLEHNFPQDYSQAVQRIRQLAEQGVATVATLP